MEECKVGFPGRGWAPNHPPPNPLLAVHPFYAPPGPSLSTAACSAQTAWKCYMNTEAFIQIKNKINVFHLAKNRLCSLHFLICAGNLSVVPHGLRCLEVNPGAAAAFEQMISLMKTRRRKRRFVY